MIIRKLRGFVPITLGGSFGVLKRTRKIALDYALLAKFALEKIEAEGNEHYGNERYSANYKRLDNEIYTEGN